MGLADACVSTASPAVRTIATIRSTEPQGVGLSPARFPRCSVMKNSASSSCGSVKIFFCTALIEANFSPLYSIIRSARLCLLSLLGAAGAAFSILRAAALSPSEPFTHMLTRAPSSACGGHRPGAGGPRRTERHRGGRRSVTTSASAGQYDSGMLFTAASRAPLRRVLRPQRCRARPYTARVALHVLTRGCRAHSFIASARQAAYSETCSRAR